MKDRTNDFLNLISSILIISSIIILFLTEQVLNLICIIIIDFLIWLIVSTLIGVILSMFGFKLAKDGSWRYNGQFIPKRMQQALKLSFYIGGLIFVFIGESLGLFDNLQSNLYQKIFPYLIQIRIIALIVLVLSILMIYFNQK